MSSEFIKVSQNDSKNQVVDVKNIKSINNIKVIRPEESEYSSSESSLSSESEVSRKKKTKKVLRKKESYQQQRQDPPQRNHDFSMFSNPKKISQQQNNDTESEYTEESSEMDSEYSEQNEEVPRTNSFEEKQKIKQDLLIKIAALEKKGFEFTKKFNMSSNFEEMMFEYEKIKKFIETQAGIKFARRCLMACVTGVEFLNKKFYPFSVNLEGWS